jgi:hypothetical protein
MIAQNDTDFGLLTPLDTDLGGGPVNIYDTLLQVYGYMEATVGQPSAQLGAGWWIGPTPCDTSCYAIETGIIIVWLAIFSR